jgi:Ni/Co efflux regulator RcnB
MRKFVLALAAVASVGLIVPTMTSVARAEDRVVIKERGDHHRDWHRHHHHDKKVVVIKKRHHHD